MKPNEARTFHTMDGDGNLAKNMSSKFNNNITRQRIFNNNFTDECFWVAEFCVCVCPQSAIIVIYCINFLSGLIFSMCLVAYKKGVYRCLSLKVAHKIDCQNGFNFNKIHFDQLNHYFIDILFMRDAGGLASPPWLTHIINYISYFYTEYFLVKLMMDTETLKKL